MTMFTTLGTAIKCNSLTHWGHTHPGLYTTRSRAHNPQLIAQSKYRRYIINNPPAASPRLEPQEEYNGTELATDRNSRYLAPRNDTVHEIINPDREYFIINPRNMPSTASLARPLSTKSNWWVSVCCVCAPIVLAASAVPPPHRTVGWFCLEYWTYLNARVIV